MQSNYFHTSLARSRQYHNHILHNAHVVIIVEQANLGMIFSAIKSVGKSLTTKMLLYAQGVPGLKHSLEFLCKDGLPFSADILNFI